MKWFFYYALHSVKNQIRKLLKTWVLIVLAACVVLGALVGIGVSVIDSGEDGAAVEQPADSAVSDDPVAQIDLPAATQGHAVVELIAGAVILAVLFINALGADKNGSKIFLPADVNLLFSAPLQPQSVLLFRLMTQLGMILFGSVYLLFQLPNLIKNVGMSLWAALSLILAWFLTIGLGKLLQVLLYTVGSTHPGLKPRLRRGIYGVLAALAAAYFIYQRQSGLSYWDAAVALFAAPASRAIPVWGWLKGAVMFAIEGAWGKMFLCVGGCVAAGCALLIITRHVKADFYEDAMARSEETAELMEQAAQARRRGGLTLVHRKKERSEKIRRDAFHFGHGASVFFFKTLYNRFRFARLGVFTKTAETYLLSALAVSALCRYVFQSQSVIPVSLVLAVLVFYRTLGDPLNEDTRTDLFRLVPERMERKLFCSMAAGVVNCLLDTLPAMLAAVLLLRGNAAEALLWLLLIASVDFFGTATGTFINLSVSVSAGKTVKQVVQVLFLYFGLLPDAAILLIGLSAGAPAAALLGATAVNAVLGSLFFLLCPLFLEPGRR